MEQMQKLLAKKQELEQLIKNKMENVSTPMAEWNDELSAYDQHPGDQATDLFEREKEFGILELLQFELEKVNDALNRSATGQGQVCSQCGQPIEPRRLQRLVNTTLCARCAHHYDGAYHADYEIVPQPAIISDVEQSFPGTSYEVFQD
ncbi:MAG: hypothetical protein GXY49_05950 [Syntrophomonadaceae bacterium]|nr:hypothetical protein [Syntrophomonadaceae bacterium]